MSGGLILSDAHGAPWLTRFDPRLKLAWLAWVSTLSIVLDSTAALATLFIVAALSVVALRMRATAWLVVFALLLAIVWSTLLSQALFYAELPRTVLVRLIPPFEWNGRVWSGLSLSREGALYGLTQSLRLLAVMMAGLTVCLSTSPERLLAALGRLRVPVAIGFTTVTALRFLPLLADELATVRRARRLRGYGGSRTTRFSLRGEVALFYPVLAAGLRRATTLAASVASRGFDPLERRTYYPALRFRSIEWLMLGTLAATWIGIATVKLLYWLYLAELFYRPSLRGWYDVARLWL
ncbi:MAG: energy-coupling factor transporter transmembrane protein EcfT [Pirellulales bacterium]|nr:energy-coupling factor transporter transmembrane protein EcfT [Pirellulales bacterium]